MNKVVSIEIARQVFWIEEAAYDALRQYLEQIQCQLRGDDSADEIYKDIELRVAELLYTTGGNESKAIAIEQIESVTEQVGFIDSEDVHEIPEAQRKVFRDMRSKIVAGVCSGLALRFGVPAFIIRLAFIAAAAFFGLGVVLYLIFWVSLKPNDNRNAALAAEGKSRTAKGIADYQAPKVSPLLQLQRIIFLPFSIASVLISLVAQHFKRKSNLYLSIGKNIFAVGFLILAAVFTAITLEFHSSRFFPSLISWLLSAAFLYLIALIAFVYFREYYFSKNQQKVSKRLKLTAFIPVLLLVLSSWYLNSTQEVKKTSIQERQFELSGKRLAVEVNNVITKNYSDFADINVVAVPMQDQKVHVNVEYSGYGRNEADSIKNLQSINYYFNYENNRLTLNEQWQLIGGALNRGQSVSVNIKVPQNIYIDTAEALFLEDGQAEVSYRMQLRGFQTEVSIREDAAMQYLVKDKYMHEQGGIYNNKLSPNERSVLVQAFCDEFFISEYWHCAENIRQDVEHNFRFDRAYFDDSKLINQIRDYLHPDRSIFVSNIADINRLLNVISIEYPVKTRLQSYIDHLLAVKAQATE